MGYLNSNLVLGTYLVENEDESDTNPNPQI